MVGRFTRVLCAAAGGAALAISGLASAGAVTAGQGSAHYPAAAAHATARPPASAAGLAAAPGDPLWLERYTSQGKNGDYASAVAVSPNGRMVFVTGTARANYATVAYRVGTGTQVWVARYNGPGNSGDFARSVAVSPDGSKVFVTGYSMGTTSNYDYATVAYDAATGARLWVARYSGPGNQPDYASDVAVSRSGRVVVTGLSYGRGLHGDYATVAYSTADGAQLWAARYNGPATGLDYAHSVAFGPYGQQVYVTGESYGTASGRDYATVAYGAWTGARLWAVRYNGPGNGWDSASTVAVNPGGNTVFVTGHTQGRTSVQDYMTLAYWARNGAQLWTARYNGPANANDYAYSMAISPSGRTVFVTGGSDNPVGLRADAATVAYLAATGAQAWAARYNGPADGADQGQSIAVSPDGSAVYITGSSQGISTGSFDYATLSYAAGTGQQQWLARYSGPGNSRDQAFSVAVSPDGTKVLVTGTGSSPTTGEDYVTLAYRG